ncbi:MAG: hypothetical protein WBG86_07600 [Polyangiales bacterium]
MKTLVTLMAALGIVASGCGDDIATDEPIGPITYTISDLLVLSDECEIHDPDEPFTGAFEVIIDGNIATMEHTTLVLDAVTFDYSPEDETVIMTGDSSTSEFDPCRVDFLEAFTLVLDDPNQSLDENETIDATWDHTETDASDVADACDGVWFVPLPCTSRATFTLTQTSTP